MFVERNYYSLPDLPITQHLNKTEAERSFGISTLEKLGIKFFFLFEEFSDIVSRGVFLKEKSISSKQKLRFSFLKMKKESSTNLFSLNFPKSRYINGVDKEIVEVN